jgi:hypothetical protein
MYAVSTISRQELQKIFNNSCTRCINLGVVGGYLQHLPEHAESYITVKLV